MSDLKNKLLSDRSTPVILVVEDSPADQLILKRILEHAGYQILIANSGKSGLDLLKQCKNQKINIAAIVSDILMPVMDGIQFLHEVRKQRETRNIPFLFMTAIDASLMWDTEKYGANGYLTKPISPKHLLAKIKELVSLPKREQISDEAA